MERIVRGRSATLMKTFYVYGIATDPTGTPTAVVTRASDGTTVTTGSVVNEAAPGTWSVTIPSTSNDLLDTLTVEWTGVVGGLNQQYIDTVEVAGDVLFTVAEARAMDPLQNTTKYTTAQILEARTLAEQALEDACDVAFVPRYGTEALDGSGGSGLMLSQPRVTAIRSVMVGGVAYTSPQLAGLVARPTGILVDTAGSWSAGYGNVTVGYEHGYDRPPERVRRAALLLAKSWLIAGPVDDRATSFSSEDGTFLLSTPGMRGSVFGIPEVDVVVQQYGMRVGIA